MKITLFSMVSYSWSKMKLLRSLSAHWTPTLSATRCTSTNFSFVPRHEECTRKDIDQLQEFVSRSGRLFVLTGAGVSTESGIPDYRSEGVGLYSTSTRRPVQIKDFMSSAAVRQSYWARNFSGYKWFSSSVPNTTHRTLAKWQEVGKVGHIVTQNVDRLHHKAGSSDVVELHGTALEVRCMECQYSISREHFQTTLMEVNPNMTIVRDAPVRPDADVELSPDVVKTFTVPDCPDCGGILKPFIVFFGDNVPRPRVENVKRRLKECDAFLALGTSLQVYSAYRFLLQAKEDNMPCAAVNIGPTRADHLLDLRIPARCGYILPFITV